MLELGEGEGACGKSPFNILVSTGYTVRPQYLGKRWVFVYIFRHRNVGDSQAGCKEPGARSLEQGAWSKEPGAMSLEQGAWSKEPGARSLKDVLAEQNIIMNILYLMVLMRQNRLYM